MSASYRKAHHRPKRRAPKPHLDSLLVSRGLLAGGVVALIAIYMYVHADGSEPDAPSTS
jgi:hypothetical protein